MKILYFDCFAGASGDMILGACLDLGVDIDFLNNELQKLDIDRFEITDKKTTKHSLSGTHCIVTTQEVKHNRNLNDIEKIINNSSLSNFVKDNALKSFQLLAKAEAKVHNTSIDKIHFHEVGALDAIIDIVGAMICFEHLNSEKIYCSSIHVGNGFTKSAHGTIPIPSPATIEILKNCPIYTTGIQKELTTPTGAAILKTMVTSFGNMPKIEVTSIGYGCGTRDLEIPNMLRVVMGETNELQISNYETDTITQIETNIDDMNPQVYEYLSDCLFEVGVLDVTLTQTLMKKQRPAVILTVLVEQTLQNKAIEIIFSESTTIGLRIQNIKRVKLKRESKIVKTTFGDVSVKFSTLNGKTIQIKPEYEDCKMIAKKQNVPLAIVIEEAKYQASLD